MRRRSKIVIDEQLGVGWVMMNLIRHSVGFAADLRITQVLDS